MIVRLEPRPAWGRLPSRTGLMNNYVLDSRMRIARLVALAAVEGVFAQLVANVNRDCRAYLTSNASGTAAPTTGNEERCEDQCDGGARHWRSKSFHFEISWWSLWERQPVLMAAAHNYLSV